MSQSAESGMNMSVVAETAAFIENEHGLSLVTTNGKTYKCERVIDINNLEVSDELGKYLFERLPTSV